MTPIRHIEDHLERGDAAYARFLKIQERRERKNLIRIVVRLNVGIISILCVLYAIYMQF